MGEEDGDEERFASVVDTGRWRNVKVSNRGEWRKMRYEEMSFDERRLDERRLEERRGAERRGDDKRVEEKRRGWVTKRGREIVMKE